MALVVVKQCVLYSCFSTCSCCLAPSSWRHVCQWRLWWIAAILECRVSSVQMLSVSIYGSFSQNWKLNLVKNFTLSHVIWLLMWLKYFASVEKEVGGMEMAHEGMIWSLAWHPLGHILCSGSNDHTRWVSVTKLSCGWHRVFCYIYQNFSCQYQ